LIPLKDNIPTVHFPIVTVALIVLNIGMYFFFQHGDISLGEPSGRDYRENVVEYGSIPYEITHPGEQCPAPGAGPEACRDRDTGLAATWITLFTSIFMHGGLFHLGGNMLFLWIFGNNIEDHLGHFRYLFFYVASGIVATGAHIAVQPASTVPLVGASGAVAGVMGAYLVWFPRTPIRTIVIFFLITFVEIQARWLLGFWFLTQFFIDANQGVAWMAHVGGFVFGVAVALLVKLSRRASHAIWTKDHWSELERPRSGPHDDFGLR
jgi:membrane associated rhomboid family serine protease